MLRDLKIFVAVIVTVSVLPLPASGQNLLRAPESVVYDSIYDRYLVSNWQTGHIVAIDNQGNQSYFVQNQYCKNGLHIAGNTVYAAGIDRGIKGFDLTDTSLVMHVMIDGMVNLNDITSDTSGNLYVTDVYGSKIYKIRLSDQSYSVFADDGINYPNGIYFDARHNRLLLVSFRGNSPIQAIDLEDSTVTTIVNTGRHNLDGITEDNSGNIYFSSWTTTSIYMYDSLFSHPPELFYSNAGGPADIFFDRINNIMAVPVMNYNMVEFLDGPTSIDDSYYPGLPGVISLHPNYPNPFNPGTDLIYSLRNAGTVSLAIFDTQGREVVKLVDEWRPAGTHTTIFDGSRFSTGIYFAVLSMDGQYQKQKMLLLK